MIDQELINSVQRYIDNDDDLHPEKAQELLDNYKKLVVSEAALLKELVKLRDEKVSLELVESLVAEDDWPK